jgi:hypothetical protein
VLLVLAHGLEGGVVEVGDEDGPARAQAARRRVRRVPARSVPLSHPLEDRLLGRIGARAGDAADPGAVDEVEHARVGGRLYGVQLEPREGDKAATPHRRVLGGTRTIASSSAGDGDGAVAWTGVHLSTAVRNPAYRVPPATAPASARCTRRKPIQRGGPRGGGEWIARPGRRRKGPSAHGAGARRHAARAIDVRRGRRPSPTQGD